ncbi:hypothetical protein [Lamprocystis purpurea]|jgi:hypothetical protein|uniref:hypothetical protein n=1 Tax=Lamprocystis purpurea TaxID=61598 RepID=UPI0012FCE06B|nr:hypothetical protein [Lamprocystis purpurea]
MKWFRNLFVSKKNPKNPRLGSPAIPVTSAPAQADRMAATEKSVNKDLTAEMRDQIFKIDHELLLDLRNDRELWQDLKGHPRYALFGIILDVFDLAKKCTTMNDFLNVSNTLRKAIDDFESASNNLLLVSDMKWNALEPFERQTAGVVSYKLQKVAKKACEKLKLAFEKYEAIKEAN